jgi:chemotaxis protein MotB
MTLSSIIAGKRKPNKQGFSRAPVWMTIYADMMTNLMLFFLMLYAMSRIEMDARERARFQQAFGDEMLGRNQTIEARHKMTESDIAKEASKIKGFIASDEARIRLSLPGEVLFDSGSADLKASAAGSLEQVLAMIKKIPNKIMIEGHTDDNPVHSAVFISNWDLSLARAESVVDFLVSQGVPRERLCLAGYGEFKPMVPNSDDINRAKNRRIEISIITVVQ